MENIIIKKNNLNEDIEIIHKIDNTIELNKVFKKLNTIINNNERIEEDVLLSCIDDIKINIYEYNKSIDNFKNIYNFHKELYINNIKKWDNIRNDFNNDSIIFFY